MIIALDYDGTYTRAPRLWDDFAALADAGGHSVVAVTMRDENDPLPAEPPGVPVHYTGGQPKAAHMEDHGILVDVWIDDDPQAIVGGCA